MQAIDIYRKLVDLIDGGVSLAVATVLSTQGSAPQRPGAKVVIEATGHLWGTVGGGAVEGETTRVAIEACRSQNPVVLDFQLENDDAEQAAAICGGRMRILIDPTVARHRACYGAAADAMTQRRRGVLLTTIRRPEPIRHPERSEGSPSPYGAQILRCAQNDNILRDGDPHRVAVEWLPADSIAEASGSPDARTLRSCLQQGRPERIVDGLQSAEVVTEIFVDPVIPRPLLLIAGGGHVGQALAAQATTIGFDVAVLDDRPEFTDAALFPFGVQTRCGPVGQLLGEEPMSEDTYVVIVTRGHRHDAEALAACIRRRPAYLGMIGSRRKVALLKKHFLEHGLASEEEFARVFAPIGLAIGAETVAEIAVSIAAQLIAVRRKSIADATEGDCPDFCGRTPQKWDCPPKTS